MTPQEAVILTRYVKACCPGSQIDEYTPDAWHDLLGDLRLDDCRAAVASVAKRQPFVAPAEIRAEVRRIRNERIAHSVIEAPPAELAGDPRAYQRVLIENIRKAADGQGVPASPERPALTAAQQPGRAPVSLRAALTDLRRAPGPGWRRRGGGDPQALAAEQVAEVREIRAKSEGGEVA